MSKVTTENVEELSLEETVAAQYGRVKGASWFPLLYKKDILVLGQGGIGSWASLLLSRIGANLHIYDMDNYEAHNMTGQIVGADMIGKSKVEAMWHVIAQFSPDCAVETYNEKYTQDSQTNDVVICGFDNMQARKDAFAAWKAYVSTLTFEEASKCFFQDGRLLSEQLQIFNIPGDNPEWAARYEKEFLPGDEEFSDEEEPECTFKQTSHCAAMIASHMVGFLTNWASNALGEGKGPKRIVPFYHEYIVPLNLSENV